LDPEVNAIETAGVTLAVRLIVIVPEVAVGDVAQVSFDVITQLTTSEFANVVLVKVVLFVPAFTPFTFHWYDGVVPPFEGVAVKVNELPAQPGLDPEVNAIETAGVTLAVRLIVIVPEVAVAEVTQVAFDVITQLTTSAFANVVLVKVALFVPAFTPFTFH
jgi:hypothetical protein